MLNQVWTENEQVCWVKVTPVGIEYLFLICDLFIHAVSSSDNIVSSDRMINELEGSGIYLEGLRKP
jgi:hypothetical protein